MIQQLPHAFSTPRCSASAERPPACRACVRITIHSAHWNPLHQQFLSHAFFYLTYLRLYDDTLYIVPLARSFKLHGSFTASVERPPACRACVRFQYILPTVGSSCTEVIRKRGVALHGAHHLVPGCLAKTLSWVWFTTILFSANFQSGSLPGIGRICSICAII